MPGDYPLIPEAREYVQMSEIVQRPPPPTPVLTLELLKMGTVEGKPLKSNPL